MHKVNSSIPFIYKLQKIINIPSIFWYVLNVRDINKMSVCRSFSRNYLFGDRESTVEKERRAIEKIRRSW